MAKACGLNDNYGFLFSFGKQLHAFSRFRFGLAKNTLPALMQYQFGRQLHRQDEE